MQKQVEEESVEERKRLLTNIELKNLEEDQKEQEELQSIRDYKPEMHDNPQQEEFDAEAAKD